MNRLKRAIRLRRKARRGSAILAVLLITLAISALAGSAIYLTGNASILAGSYDREREFKYASEAALAMGKSRLNFDPLALPDSGYATLLSEGKITGADNVQIPAVSVNLFVGPSGSTSGQFGRFASVVAEARDASGARFVRRLELTQESFAKYAYWSNEETNNAALIYFGNNDHLWGPVWSNDVINISSNGGATFHDEVGTAKTISGVAYGTFSKGYSINQRPIQLPNNTKLASLQGYASAGNFSFTAPTSGAASGVRMRLEFVATDLGGTADSTGVDEGFVKIYIGAASQSPWVRGDWTSTASAATNCGAFYRTVPGGPKKFFPVSVHGTAWFKAQIQAGGMTSTQATDTSNASLATILSKGTARCFLGGDPRLVAVERNSASFTNAQKQRGGEDTTFTATGVKGSWVKYPGTVDPRLKARRPWDADYLFPIYRGLNPGTKGVIHVAGTAGVSGVLRGRTTLYATGTIVVLDDLRYATDPSTGRCADILGLLAGSNITIADNALLGAKSPTSGTWRNYDETKDVFLHSVTMALNTSFAVENYDSGPTNANGCEGAINGRGCLYLTGGVIQKSRGPVGTSAGYGYSKRYSYDRCARINPPPYFPTTGRFIDNRYYEIDPVRFNVGTLFARLVPGL